MHRIASRIVQHRKGILVGFLLLLIVSGLAIPFVKINYNMADYVPESAPSTVALHKMAAEFDDAIPNVRVAVPNTDPFEALSVKARIEALPGVSQVLWLDDFADMKQPVETMDSALVSAWYEGGTALFAVAADTNESVPLKAALQEIAGEEGAVEGQIVDLAMAQHSVSSEITMIMLFIIPIGLGILMLATDSWMAPFLLLTAIGAAVILNLGSNLFKEDVSFLTQAVTAVLQLAVSMDYGIFLLHRYEQYRSEGDEPLAAMQNAIEKSLNPILASSMTTVFGFLALVFMRFQIGPDLGVVLAKGVVFSLLSVLLLLPALVLLFSKTVEKTRHRPLLPSFAAVGRFVNRTRVPVLILVALCIVPAFLAQQNNDFIYGMTGYPSESREERDREYMETHFGKNLSMAILVPIDRTGTERQLHRELDTLPEVLGILSFQTQVGQLIPAEVLPQKELRQIRSEDMSRLILTVRSEKEGEKAFALVESIREIGAKLYGDDFYLVGESVVTYDMRTTIQKDNLVVNGLAVLAVAIVLLISLRSLTLPILLVLTIEASIWFNLSVPFLQGSKLSFIGYLIISTVQLGATVDYAILFTQHYTDERRTLAPREAAQEAVAQSVGTLLPPALILTAAGAILSIISTLGIVSELGTVLARGAAFSFLMVIFFLPGVLVLLDGWILKTTRGMRDRKETP